MPTYPQNVDVIPRVDVDITTSASNDDGSSFILVVRAGTLPAAMRRSTRSSKQTQFFELEFTRKSKRARDIAPSPPPAAKRPPPVAEAEFEDKAAVDETIVEDKAVVDDTKAAVSKRVVPESTTSVDTKFGAPTDDDPQLGFLDWLINHRDAIVPDIDLAKQVRHNPGSAGVLMNAFVKARTAVFRNKIVELMRLLTVTVDHPDIDRVLKQPEFDMITFAFVAVNFDKWDVNGRFSTGLNLLEYAILRSDLPAIQWLRSLPKLDKTASVGFACRHASTTVWSAIGFAPEHFLTTDRGGNNVWTMMVRMNRVDLVGVSPSFYIDRRDDNGISPIALACLFWNLPMVQALKLRGANLFAKLSDGLTPLHLGVGCKLLLPLFTSNERLSIPDDGSVAFWACMSDTSPSKWQSECPGNQRQRDDLFDPDVLIKLFARWPTVIHRVDWSSLAEFGSSVPHHRRTRLLLQHFAFAYSGIFLTDGKFMNWFHQNHAPQWFDSSLIAGSILHNRLDLAHTAMQYVSTSRIIDIVQHFMSRLSPEYAQSVNDLVKTVALKRSA